MATTQTGGQAIETMFLEERRYEPPPEFVEQANAQPDIYERDWEEFWETEGRERISWFEPFTTPAAEVYQATAAVTMPAQPPACSHQLFAGWRPDASRKKPITSRTSVI